MIEEPEMVEMLFDGPLDRYAAELARTHDSKTTDDFCGDYTVAAERFDDLVVFHCENCRIVLDKLQLDQ